MTIRLIAHHQPHCRQRHHYHCNQQTPMWRLNSFGASNWIESTPNTNCLGNSPKIQGCQRKIHHRTAANEMRCLEGGKLSSNSFKCFCRENFVIDFLFSSVVKSKYCRKFFMNSNQTKFQTVINNANLQITVALRDTFAWWNFRKDGVIINKV